MPHGADSPPCCRPASPAAPPAAGRSWRAGFTLLELLLALALAGLVAGLAVRLLLDQNRIYRRQAARVEVQANLKTAAAVLPAELLELDPADTAGGDLLVAGDTAVTYRAMRGVFFACRRPVSTGYAQGEVIAWREPSFGLRDVDPRRDSVFLYGGARDSAGGGWGRADVVAPPREGPDCPGAAPGVTLVLAGVQPADWLGRMDVGSPVRAFEPAQLAIYRDGSGDRWLGLRGHTKPTGWGAIQPVLGPLADGGLRFSYVDAAGRPVSEPREAARLRVSVRVVSPRPVWRLGRWDHLEDTARIELAFRNASEDP